VDGKFGDRRISVGVRGRTAQPAAAANFGQDSPNPRNS